MNNSNKLLYQCRVDTNEEGDNFVGIRSDGETIEVCFPLGYNLGDTQEEQKKDIQTLIRVLSRFSSSKEKLLPQMLIQDKKTVNFPIQAYLSILEDYYSRGGYYTEAESVYRTNSKRPTHWPKTIRQKRPYPQDGSFVYLATIARETVVDSSNIITKINQFCVNEAWEKIGWLFTSTPPQKSSIVFQEHLFIAALREKLAQTNNEKNKILISSMIEMISYLGKNKENKRFYYGTAFFEHVWERLIDFNFGIRNKEDYFPKTAWYLGNGDKRVNSALEPDTIMLANGKVFILDAKYYRFGATAVPSDLPMSTSINKQITYGEYVATEDKFKNQCGISPTVYNVFLMPYDSTSLPFKTGRTMYRVGEARGDWKKSGAEYEKVQGVLLDIKWLMQRAVRQNPKDINTLAQLVENEFTVIS